MGCAGFVGWRTSRVSTMEVADVADFVAAMPAAAAARTVESELLPGWNVLVYESPEQLAQSIGGFVQRRFG